MTAFRPHSHHLGVARSVLGDAGFPRLPWMYLWVYSRCFWVWDLARRASMGSYSLTQRARGRLLPSFQEGARPPKWSWIAGTWRSVHFFNALRIQFNFNFPSWLAWPVFFLHISDLGMVENVEFEPLVNCSSRESQRMVVFKATLFWILSYDNWL